VGLCIEHMERWKHSPTSDRSVNPLFFSFFFFFFVFVFFCFCLCFRFCGRTNEEQTCAAPHPSTNFHARNPACESTSLSA